MGKKAGSKLNQLQTQLPDTLLVSASWLKERGYSSSLIAKYVQSGWLEHPARGIYRRPGGKVTWPQVLTSLQSMMRTPCVVGGRSSLELHGFSHFVSPKGLREIHIYVVKKPPSWLQELHLEVTFLKHRLTRLFPTENLENAFEKISWNQEEYSFTDISMELSGIKSVAWGEWRWPIYMSEPERAVLEMLEGVPENESFYDADVIFEGLSTMGPDKMQKNLEACKSIKAKRLFSWFADRHRPEWWKHINKGRIELGSGKRQIALDGKLDSTYQITVPKELDEF